MTNKHISPTVDSSSYACPITVDCAIFGFQENTLKVLLVKRSIAPFKDSWLLPGGILFKDQTLEETINTLLFELTGISGIRQQQVKIYSDINRHLTKRVVTVCYYALVKPEEYTIIAKHHFSDIQWFSIDEVLPKLAFDHSTLFKDALNRLKRNLKRRLVFGDLLSEEFTLKELQDLYENILKIQLDRRNFRKKIMQMDLLEPTGNKKKGVRGGPELYKLKVLDPNTD